MTTVLPCAIYTRKSSEEGLEQGFNSLDAQREACDAYVLSQKAQGWKALGMPYDDGGFSGGNTERPGLQRLLADIAAKRVKIVVVYKVDRLTRSLADFAKLVELFDAQGVSFVSVTQQFNTTSSMGRLTLNVLLSFAQFEREVTGERIRDKIAASKRKGMWMGGFVPVGYLPHERTLVIDPLQAERVREIYRKYLALGQVRSLKLDLERSGWTTPVRATRRANMTGGRPFSRGHLYRILSNPIYIGQISHKGVLFDGQHPAIIDQELWQAVQDRLAANLRAHGLRSTMADPSLLSGLVFDGEGQRLAPTHTKKGARRYRYYVGQAGSGNADETTLDDSKFVRWPAQELENAVVTALVAFLGDASRLLGLMGNVEATEVKRKLKMAAHLGQQLSSAAAAEKIDLLKRFVARIVVNEDCMELMIRRGTIGLPRDVQISEDAEHRLVVPMELKRRGGSVRLIVQVPGAKASRVPDSKLVALITKAHDWFARLRSGSCNSIKMIAKEEGLNPSHVVHVVYLAFLDPTIVERICRGEHPVELTPKKLIRSVPLPMDWREQRVLLGFEA